MSDTVRSQAELLVLFADNTSGDISAQDMRDFTLSAKPNSFQSFNTSSASSFAVGTGSKTFTVDAGLEWSVSHIARIQSNANAANWMEGPVTSYSSTSLIVNVTSSNGSGTHTDWSINLQGFVSGGSPGGSDTQIQYNDSDAFGASSSYVIAKDTTDAVLTVTGSNSAVVSVNADGVVLSLGGFSDHSGIDSETDITLRRDDGETTKELVLQSTDLVIGDYTVPLADGSPNQVLVTDGMGEATWQDQSGSGGTWSFNEQPTGTVNGSNPDFEVDSVPIDGTQIMVFKNGLCMFPGSGNDYTITDNVTTSSFRTITFESGQIPSGSDLIIATYMY